MPSSEATDVIVVGAGPIGLTEFAGARGIELASDGDFLLHAAREQAGSSLARMTSPGPEADVFVTQLDVDGAQLRFSTYLCGTFDRAAQANRDVPADPHNARLHEAVLDL